MDLWRISDRQSETSLWILGGLSLAQFAAVPVTKRGSRQDLQLAKMLSTDGSGHGTHACRSSSNMWLKHNLHKCSCSGNIERISVVVGIDFDRSVHHSFLQLASPASGLGGPVEVARNIPGQRWVSLRVRTGVSATLSPKAHLTGQGEGFVVMKSIFRLRSNGLPPKKVSDFFCFRVGAGAAGPAEEAQWSGLGTPQQVPQSPYFLWPRSIAFC